MRLITLLALALGAAVAHAQTINAVYFGQTHVLKATDAYFGLVGNREALIKVHVTAPGSPASPAVTATLTLSGQPNQVLTLTGPATLPASIPDGLGVVQHSYANTFTGIIPATYVKKGLQITVNAGTASTSLTNLDIGAPTKVVMTMFDVQYFSDTNNNYPANTFAELEAKWPVADLELRRLGHVVFPELVIPPRQDVGTKAVRIKSKAEYQAQTGLSFDGEQSAALEWNGALKRAAGQSGRWSLYYLNVYNAFAGGQAGGFAGVGSGTSVGILHHELGHALSLPHWGDNAAYPYKGDMHGIQAPTIYNDTHAGPAWAFHLPTRAFIPPTVQSGNAGGKPVGTYKADPMQGGGEGWQEPAYLMNHFSDYSMDKMRTYLQGHVVVWNSALNSWASWNQATGDYTTTVSNNGVQFPTTRDTQVISILASVSGSNPGINMVYPPIGPYTAGLIQLFDPTVAADRTAAQTKFAPTNGCDYCVRVVQGGVTKTYMLAASNLTSADPFAESSLLTEAVNLPASGGAVTKIELLSTPNAEDVGLPANPTVLYTWAPLMPEPGTFELPPTANSSSAITMTALPGEVAFGFTGGTVEYQFTETSGNPGATDSAWQTSRSYTDTGLQAGTNYSYTVAIRAGTLATSASAPASATTPAASFAGTITVNGTEPFALQSGNGYKAVTGLGTFDAATADKLVVVIAAENANNDHFAIFGVRYNGVQMIEAVQQTGVTADGALAIYYLDNPGPVGSGITVSGYNPNGGLGTAYALSGTRPGFGAFTSRKGSSVTSVPITTSASNSLVIAALQNSGNNNNAGTPTANSPLIQTHSANWSGWGSLASGHIQVATPSTVTPTFTTNTGGSYHINIAAVEFLAEAIPASTWVQTAGGAQNWTTGANWILGTAPSPLAGDTVDFSTVNIAANTTLSLGANRTGGLWKFGDTAGAETWTVSSGNTITLAGTTPTIEVVNNSAQLDCLIAGTAGLTKTGTGTLGLSASNTYTGVTRISAGTLQAAILANGGSNSSIGASSNAATNLILNGGTLEYTGAAVSTNRLFSLQASSTIDASGTGAVNFTATGSMGFNSNTAAKTLTLDGTNTGANTLAAIIGDNTGVTSLTKSGTGTWVLSGANTYTGATTINGGTLRLANLAAVQDSSQVNINNGTNAGTLQLATNTAFATFPLLGAGSNAQATIVSDRATAGAGLTHLLGAANMGVNTYHFTAGTNVTSGTAGIALASVSLSGGGTGTTILNPTTANLTILGEVTIPSGGTTKTLNLGGTSTANSAGGAITNGIGTLSLTKSNTGTWVLSGLSASAASNYSGKTTIGQGTLAITTVSPSLTGGITFGTSAGSTTTGTLDLSAASATFAGAASVVTNSATANTITIGTGKTLTLNGGLTIGYDAGSGFTGALPTILAADGGGTIAVNGTAITIGVNQAGTANQAFWNAATLDATSLGAFNANVTTFNIGVGTQTQGPGTVLLSNTANTILATTLTAGDTGGNNGRGPGTLMLGTGTNLIQADTIQIGRGKSSGNGFVKFASQTSGSPGTVTILNKAGSGAANITVGDNGTSPNTAGGANGTFDLRGHVATVTAGTLTIGKNSMTSNSGGVTGTVFFDAGTFTVNTIAMASKSGSNTGAANATLTIGGGSFTLNSGGSFTLGSQALGGSANGTLNLTGGTLTSNADIVDGGGTTTTAITLNGGTLDMTGKNLGGATPIDTLNFQSGTLKNVASINGTGGLTKTTAGILTLGGTNTYSGTTTISGGTLALGASNAIPATAVSIGSATLNAATFTDTFGTLDVTSSAIINLGSGATLAFADSSAIDWTGGTLALTGTFVSGSSLRFGTTSDGLTPAQLAKIGSPVFSNFSLNANGYLIGTPTGGTTYTITNTTTDVNGTCTPTGVASVGSGGSQTYTLTPNPDYTVATLTVNGVPVTPALSYTFNNVSANQTISATFVLATTLYWDSDSTTPGFGNSTGTWGTSQFWSADASGSSAPLTLSTTTNSSVNFGTASLNYNQAAVTVASGGVNAGNITFGAGQSTSLTLSGGTITLGDTAVITVNNTSDTIASVLAGAGSSLTKTGTGNLILSAPNTYSGDTAIAAGTLKLGASNVLPDGPGKGNVSVTGTLDLNTYSETINGLSGAGTVDTLAGGTPTLTLGSGDTTSTFDGTITNTSGTVALSKIGTGTLTLTGANGYGGPTTISDGILALSGAGSLGGISSGITLNGGQLDLGGLSRTQGAVSVTAAAASGDTIRNGTLTSTSYAASNPADNAIISAILTGLGGFTKTGGGTVTLSAANSYNGTTTIGAGTLAITGTSSLTGGLTFGATAGNSTVGALDLSNGNATYAGALIVQTNTASANTLAIGAGKSLTVTNGMTVGFSSAANTETKLNVTGDGALNITAGNFQLGGSIADGFGNAATLDMSGLATFDYSVSGSTFRVGDATNSSSSGTGSSTLILADTSTITATAFTMNSPTAAAHTVRLGSGVNTINANTINVGASSNRSPGTMNFNEATGSLTVRATDTTGRAAMTVAYGGGTTAVVNTSSMDLTGAGHSADLLLSTLQIAGRTGAQGAASTGTFSFENGTLDATGVTVGVRAGSSGNTGLVEGTLNLGGGNVDIGASGLSVGLNTSSLPANTLNATVNISGSGTVDIGNTAGLSVTLGSSTNAGAGATAASLNLTGGTTTLTGDIRKGTATGSVTSTLLLSGGTLDMGGNDIGASGAAAAITFIAESGTLRNVGAINGSGGLTKSTAGTLVLSGTNSYGGPNTISAGTLTLGASNALPATPLSIGSATLNAATFTDTLGTLDVTGSSVINLGSGAALAFADSSAIDWTGGTLAITGTFVSGSSLRFGTTTTALTTTQLSNISGGGFTSFSLNSSGYLVGSNGATFTNWQTANNTAGAFTTDHDNDGVANGIEYFIGGSSNTTGQTPLPGITNTAGTLSVTWTKSATYPGTYDTHFWVESSETLTGTWTTETVGGNVTINGNNITYTFPAGTKRFARLKVIGPQ